MIEGLRIDMTCDELVTRLNGRIVDHQRGSSQCEERIRYGDASSALRTDTPRHIIEHERDEHLEQVHFLTLLRDHLVTGEIYRLGPDDLRVADLMPDTPCW